MPGCTDNHHDIPGIFGRSRQAHRHDNGHEPFTSSSWSTSQKRHRIYKEIVDWLQSLYRETRADEGEPHRKSLLGLCLRKIPACISDIEDWDKAMAQDQAPRSVHQSSNAALEIYSQLESFGATGFGWRPMKQTVRAHALWSLRKAISDGLFNSKQACGFVRQCLAFEDTSGATSLAKAVQRDDVPSGAMNLDLPSPDGFSIEALESLVRGALARSGSPLCPVFEEMSELLETGRLHAAWLTTRPFFGLLRTAVGMSISERAHTAALGFVKQAARTLCTGRSPGIRFDPLIPTETLTSIVADLVSGTLIELGGQVSKARTRAAFSLDCCVNEVRTLNRQESGTGLFILRVAQFLALDEDLESKGFLEDEARRYDEDLDIYTEVNGITPSRIHDVLNLVCSIAQTHHSKTSTPAHESFMRLCQRLEQLPWPAKVFAAVRRDGAFALAQKTNDLRDLAFAEGQMAHEKPPASAGKNTGWFWEEAIGEFVVRTPDKWEGDVAENRAEPRTPSQTRHEPTESPRVGQLMSEEATVVGSDSDIGPDLRNAKCGAANDSEETIIISMDEDSTMICSEEGTEQQDNRVYASSPSLETKLAKTSCTGKGRKSQMQGRRTTAKAETKHRRNGPSLGFPSSASIGGARQLLTVRGPGGRSGGKDDDWVAW